MREKVIAMAMTFDGQRSSCRSDVEEIGQCAKEEVSSSLLGKLAPPFLCYKHIPSYKPIRCLANKSYMMQEGKKIHIHALVV